MVPRGDPPLCGHNDCGCDASETGRPGSKQGLASTSRATSAALFRYPSARRRGAEGLHRVTNERGIPEPSGFEKKIILKGKYMSDHYAYGTKLHQNRPRAECEPDPQLVGAECGLKTTPMCGSGCRCLRGARTILWASLSPAGGSKFSTASSRITITTPSWPVTVVKSSPTVPGCTAFLTRPPSSFPRTPFSYLLATEGAEY
jgi:hypothetical protein